jgi:GNAT superfamily N-acetyltransferase
MMSGEPQGVGRVATAGDIPAVAACLASAFHDDPLWGHWTFPDVETRARGLGIFMKLMAELGLGDMWTEMTAAAEAVTVWTPPGLSPVTPELEARMAAVFADLFGPRKAALDALFEQFEENLPDGRYYHLEWWAAHRDHLGKGLGTALLRENLARVDAEGLPVYLESTNPVNLPRYEALGFRAIGAFAPPGGPPITRMWREPSR